MAQVPHLPQTEVCPIRILLIICRPGGRYDVPFRSVANRLVTGLGEDTRALFHLDVLRPPTFEQLEQYLHAAKAESQPYHIVHFDGHGIYEDLNAMNLNQPPKNMRGYLLFENADIPMNQEFIHGALLGKILVETGVPLLVLNACRSAHAKAPAKPGKSLIDDQTRAFGSLAQEAMDAGVAGVVAMRYKVYVVTAAQFVADLYAALIQGCTLGEAVTSGRKQLYDEPLREIAYEPRRLQDWPVPVVYETAPISLFPAQDKSEALTTTLSADHATPGRGGIDPKLLERPDAGFFGRDETILALDRAFDTRQIVLLHAYAGSGKTAAAAEFARWYKLTGGVDGPVLFTSFEQYKPLKHVLDQFGDVLKDKLERKGINWLALDNYEERRNKALQVLKQIPVLWIWDNVEPVTGFPAGTTSKWSKEEQEELVDFLRDAQDTRTKFLLTSRRDERTWLGKKLPARIPIPPMPILEQVQLARAIAEKHGRRLTKIGDWRPLLKFTQGNPLTITVVVGQALRDGLRSKEQIEAFVERLRAGEAAFEDVVSEGRSKSLGASLSYGFEQAFSEEERKQLALLHFFQGIVNVGVLWMIGNPKSEWCLHEVRGLTRETGISLLDRAADIGLLTASGGGLYRIHPALPWFFKRFFNQYYASTTGDRQKVRATRAFVEAMGWVGNYYTIQFSRGNRDVAITALTFEEMNLLHARKLARTCGWRRRVISIMQGLHTLYAYTGRLSEWARLVDEIVPDFVESATDGPRLGHENDWDVVTGYRVRLACEMRQWVEAERLQHILVDWSRRKAVTALSAPPEMLDRTQREAIRNLAVTLHDLGEIQCERGELECITSYEESLALAERIDDRTAAAACASNLGYAYIEIPNLYDLANAEHWNQRGLELCEEHDRLLQAYCWNQLGTVAHRRSLEVQEAKQPKEEEEEHRHIDDAILFCREALKILPSDAVDALAVVHYQLGHIYLNAGVIESALSHYSNSIRYDKIQGNLYGTARTQSAISAIYVVAGRFADALEYARAALRNFETYDEGVAEDMQKTRGWISLIEQLQTKGG